MRTRQQVASVPNNVRSLRMTRSSCYSLEVIIRGALSELSGPYRPTRAPLKPVPEGWRRYALMGSFAIAVLGVLTTLGAVYLLPSLLPYLR
jgi:hypothetical protein